LGASSGVGSADDLWLRLRRDRHHAWALVAAGFLFTRKQKTGALLLALSMFGSFIFGFWYHFLSQTNDNVTQVHGPWHSTFHWTAIALAVIELAGALVGFRMFARAQR
jgi:hypothetical protein